jgi:hypothetical protein
MSDVIKGVETALVFPQPNQEIPPGELPEVLLERYLKAVSMFVRSPPGIDTVLGAAVVGQVIGPPQNGIRRSSWNEIFEAELTGDQLTHVGFEMSKIHIAFGIPLIMEGYVPKKAIDPEKTRQYLKRFPRPEESPDFTINTMGYLEMEREMVAESFDSVKSYALASVTRFAQGVIGMGVIADQKNLTDFDIGTVNQLSLKPGYVPYGGALLRLYMAGAGILLNDPRAEAAVTNQKHEHNLNRGGRPEFRVTEHMIAMGDLVEEAVFSESLRLRRRGVMLTAAVVGRLIDDMTHSTRLEKPG